MALLSLKISIVDFSMVKTMQFDPSTNVYDASRIIREKIPEFKGERKFLYVSMFLFVLTLEMRLYQAQLYTLANHYIN